MAISKAPVKRIIQEAGAERVNADAVDALVEYLEDTQKKSLKKQLYMQNMQKKNCKSRRY
ncbi:histone-like protein [Methanobrevibacter sp.]|uniref:histone-like protein n=1 Tax=Methanobrevibacter sp. TaxID=66852 RepID=UPI00388FCFA8